MTATRYTLSVDLGTTFTAAAVSDGGEPTMVGLGNRALQVPSVLFRTDAGFVVGEAAERRGVAEPRGLVREFKRRLGDPVPVLVDGVPFSPESLTATLLRWVVDAVGRRQGGPPDQLVLTHPASWGEYKLDVLRQVVTLAEVGPARWCPEPVAAAGQYASRSRVEPGRRLGVYDLGGGTFDACVLEKTADGFTMLGPAEGVAQLGGVDFDEAVFEQVRAVLGDRLMSLELDAPDVVTGLARLRRECVEAKEALSVDSETTVQVALPGLLTSVRVTRSELEQLIRPALDETVAAMARAIRAAGLTPTDLGGLVLVGGSSRIPLVAEVLERQLGVQTALDAHPKHDVALGALRTGAASERPGEPGRAGGGHVGAKPKAAVPGAEVPKTATPRGGVPTGAVPVRGEPQPVAQARPVPDDAGPTSPRTFPRRLWPVIAAATALVVVLAVVVVPRLLRGSPPVVGTGVPSPVLPATPTPEPTPSPSPSPTPTGAGLPQSAPLTADQLIFGMEVRGNVDLYLASTGSAAPVRRLTTRTASDRSVVLSPDFRTLVYISVAGEGSHANGKKTLRVAGAADDSGDRLLLQTLPEVCQGSISRPAWDPLHLDVLVVPCTDRGGREGLYRMRTDGTVLSKIMQPDDEVGDPAFSPDGSKLVFWSGPASDLDGGSIYVTAPDGSGPAARLTKGTTEAQDADPVFSPDGGSIAFRRRDADGTRGGEFNVYAMNADGSGKPVALADRPGSDEHSPTYSPTGAQIAYTSNAKVSGESKPVDRVWVMSSDGSDQRVLLTQDESRTQTAATWGLR